MKTFVLVILVMLSFGISNQGVYSSSSSTTTSFSLHDNNGISYRDLLISSEYIQVELKINVTSSDTELRFYYINNSGANSINLVENQNYTFFFNTTVLNIRIINEENLFANYSAVGFYKLKYLDPLIQNTNIWESFNLILSTPRSIIIFPSNDWVNNLTVDLNIQEIKGGQLSLVYATGDTGSSIYISEVGNYSYLVKAGSLILKLSVANSTYARAIGYYTITDHGKLSKDISGFPLFISIFSVIVIATKLKYNRIK